MKHVDNVGMLDPVYVPQDSPDRISVTRVRVSLIVLTYELTLWARSTGQ